MKMILIIKSTIVFILLVSSVCFSKTKCDTIINNADTLVTCKIINSKGELRRIKRFRNGIRNGIQEDYYKNGSLESRVYYVDGCRKDSSIAYYKNGSIMSIATYSNCKCNGIALSFSTKGDTLGIANYINGNCVGMYKSWHTNGITKTIEHYNNSGKKHGLSETWFENGARKDSIVYENGVSFLARYYYNSGKIRYREKYSGNLTIEGVYYDPKGKICSKIIGGNGTKIIYTIDASNCYTYKYKNGKRVN